MDQQREFIQSSQSTIESPISTIFNMSYNARDPLAKNGSFLNMTNRNITKMNFELDRLGSEFSSVNGSTSSLEENVWIRVGKFSVNSERLAIAILFTGLLILFLLVIQSWRKEKIKQNRIKKHEIAQQDLPPTYAELMLRKKPPAYKESLMQVSMGNNVAQMSILYKKLNKAI